MQTQTITKEQANNLVKIIRKVVNFIRKSIEKLMQFILRVVRKSNIKELENRVKLQENMEVVNDKCSVASFNEVLRKVYNIQIAGGLQKIQEVKRFRKCDKNISRLEGVQRKTRKPRIKMKLQRRINTLQLKSIKATAMYL